MTLSSESKYPTRRSYVLKVRGDAKRDALVGRIENLVTGEQREFASGDELLKSIASDLEAIASAHSADAAAEVKTLAAVKWTANKKEGPYE